jgi:NEDD8-activating enzyme E1 regulatory subunit
MCRFGASQLHCLGAIVGGVAAQEAIKLVTHQFVPLAGTLIYNAMSSTSAIFNF